MSPPKKPAKIRRRPPSAAYRTQSVEEETVGQLYRVRDRDWEVLWAENLSYDEAHKLKEKIAGSNRSRTVRLENMSIPPPESHESHPSHPQYRAPAPVASGKAGPADPQLEAARLQALRAASTTAADAQKRHQLAAARDRSSHGTAVRPAKLASVPAPAPAPDWADEGPETAEVLESAEPDAIDEVEVGDDLADLMMSGGDLTGDPSDDDMARAKQIRDRDEAAITARAQTLYDAQRREGDPGWGDLHRPDQARWRFEAATPRASSKG